MSTLPSHTSKSAGSHLNSSSVSSLSGECENALAGVLSDLLKTREARQLLTTIVPEFLNVWADKSSWKKPVSKLTAAIVKKQLSKPGDVFEKNELRQVFEDEAFINNLGEILPDLINQLTDILAAGSQSLEQLSFENKKNLFESLLSHTHKGRTGAVLTSCARVLNDIHKTDPEFFANTIAPGFRQWLEAADFGELKEAVDSSEKDILALVEVINDTIWEYPSKVIGILSLLPSFANMAAGSINISVEKLNAVPPDLLADIVISLMNEINGKQVAGFVEGLAEIARKIDVGSALIGEPGSPQLPKSLLVKLEEIITGIDPVVFFKGKVALARIKAVFDDALSDIVFSTPELAQLHMINGPQLSNITLRSKNKKLSSLEAMDELELEELLTQNLSVRDVQGAAELFNTNIRLINLMLEKKPENCAEFISQFLNAIDVDELTYMAEQVFENMEDDIRPLARTFVPGIVEFVCDVLKPADDENEENAARARKALGSLFMLEEA